MKNKTTYCVRSRGGQTYNGFWKDTYTLNAVNGYFLGDVEGNKVEVGSLQPYLSG